MIEHCLLRMNVLLLRKGGINNIMNNKGIVRKPFTPVIKGEKIVLESGKVIMCFSRDSTATALKRMAYMDR